MKGFETLAWFALALLAMLGFVLVHLTTHGRRGRRWAGLTRASGRKKAG